MSASPVNHVSAVQGSLAASQLRSGFATLRFRDATLEESFRQSHWKDSRVSVHLHLWLSVALVASFIFIDLWLLTRANSIELSLLRVTALLTLVAGLILTSRWGAQWRLHQRAIPALALIFGSSVVANELINTSTISFFPLIVLTVFGIYLLLGLRFMAALAIGVCLLTAYLCGSWQQQLPAHELIYNGVVLLFSNVLGASACYGLERLRRTAFLEATLLSEMASRDGLTGIYNRRAFDEQLSRFWHQAARAHRPLALLLIDIDHFKAYNDYYGHQVGDQCLQQVAGILSAACRRPMDFTARYGGEEFAVVLYDAHGDYVAEVAQHIRTELRQLGINHPASAARLLTVSIGAACVTPVPERTVFGCIQLADEALYAAKEAGRDRIVVKDSEYADLTTGAFRDNEHLAERRVS